MLILTIRSPPESVVPAIAARKHANRLQSSRPYTPACHFANRTEERKSRQGNVRRARVASQKAALLLKQNRFAASQYLCHHKFIVGLPFSGYGVGCNLFKISQSGVQFNAKEAYK